MLLPCGVILDQLLTFRQRLGRHVHNCILFLMLGVSWWWVSGAGHLAGVCLPSATTKDIPLWASTVSLHSESLERNSIFLSLAAKHPTVFLFPWKMWLTRRGYHMANTQTFSFTFLALAFLPGIFPSFSSSQQVCGVPPFPYSGPHNSTSSICSFYSCLRSHACPHPVPFVFRMYSSIELLIYNGRRTSGEKETNVCSTPCWTRSLLIIFEWEHE